jgi:cytochrome d ubiquinol oxidase subunit I
MKTHEGVSPGLTGTEAAITLAGFVLVYTTLLGLYTYVVARIIRAGPPGTDDLRDHPKRRDADDTPEAPGGSAGVVSDD